MSRLYGRAFDVYRTSCELKNNILPKYNEESKKISVNDLVSSTKILDFYLPESAINYIENYPIHVSKSPILPRSVSEFPTLESPDAKIYFKGLNFKEEHKRELAFFLGSVLALMNPDKLPGEDDLPCEYGDLFPLLVEYLYLKENNKEDRFILKHLNALKWNGEKYCKTYEAYNKHLVTDRENELLIYSEDIDSAREDFNRKYEKDFLVNSLTILVPLSSLDAMLQIIDKIKTKEDFKKIVKLVYDNPDNNRQLLLRDYGIESFGHKRLRKEINDIRGRR